MKIYRIVTPHSPKCYVGRTTSTLKRRFNQHRSAYNRWLDMTTSWCSSIGLIMLGDCSIELVEETEDNQREAYWIQQLDCVNNRRMQYGFVTNRSEYGRAYYALQSETKRKLSHAKGIIRNRVRIICDRCGTETSNGNVARHQSGSKCQTVYATNQALLLV